MKKFNAPSTPQATPAPEAAPVAPVPVPVPELTAIEKLRSELLAKDSELSAVQSESAGLENTQQKLVSENQALNGNILSLRGQRGDALRNGNSDLGEKISQDIRARKEEIDKNEDLFTSNAKRLEFLKGRIQENPKERNMIDCRIAEIRILEIIEKEISPNVGCLGSSFSKLLELSQKVDDRLQMLIYLSLPDSLNTFALNPLRAVLSWSKQNWRNYLPKTEIDKNVK